ncbi:hypothetical protein LguiA_003074 [Lonicera macranthoides]
MAATNKTTNLPKKSGAISRGYNFASTWEQNAPLTEQQQSAIVALSHAVSERPFPPNLSRDSISSQDNGLSNSTKHYSMEESGAVETALVNTNEFYKWFTDLEAAMKSETEEKYQHYVNTLTERIQTCDGILQQVDETLDLFNELQLQHQAVATKTKTLHDACDRLLVEKQRLVEFAESLRLKLNYFDELENKASKLIAKGSSPMDGQLFLIKHLLSLREQIAPFDIEFQVTHKELDFSHLLEHLRRILRGQASLFDWSRSTSLARTLSPRVLESQIDAKKDLEKSLKATCEEFIMSVTKQVVDPMLSFVTKVTAVKVALSSGTQNQRLESLASKPLKDQAFATPDKVAELVQKVNTAIQLELPRVTAKMKLFLQNPSTRMILFKPIKTNIVEAHIQVRSLQEAEYSSEERERIINMVPMEDLQRQLDNLLL